MKFSGYKGRVFVCCLTVALLAVEGRAVLFKSTADPSYNTSAPTGSLTNSGWQYEGEWKTYLGTVIAPTFFLTAKHVGGTTENVFYLNGFAYHPIAQADCPNCDLTVWQVAETFPLYAPLYSATDELGKHCVVFGRGTQRGSQVTTNSQLKGWRWGPSDGVPRWGENDVEAYSSNPYAGPLLRCFFDQNAASNECHLSVGDSSGGMFIQDGSTWKLAGIHYAVDGYFSHDGTSGAQFDAALMDRGGLWVGSGTSWTFISDDTPDYPSSFYSTRISTNVNWIKSVINFQPGYDLRIRGLRIVGPDVQIDLSTSTNSFSAGPSRLYRVERASTLVTAVWTTVSNNVAGTGGIVTVTDPGAASYTQQFYRAVLLQ